MLPHEFKSARLDKGWNQNQAADRLGVSQPHLNCLEHGKRRLTRELVRRATSVYGLSPEVLPTSEAFAPTPVHNQRLAELLAKLSYPGFSHLHSQTVRKNPFEVLLTALAQQSLDARVAEALPWVALKYAQANPWLVENARRFNLQNKLGFVVALAQKTAENHKDATRTVELVILKNALEESRLAREDSFYRPPKTETEKEWLKESRTEDARHWNLLTNMRVEQLQYA